MIKGFDSRGRSKRVAKFLSKSYTFHIKPKAIKMLYRKIFATLLEPPLDRVRYIKSKKFVINMIIFR